MAIKLKHGIGRNSAVPHVIARSGIFSSQIFRGGVKRPFATNPLKIPGLNGMDILQTYGARLDQGDADVFYEVARLHLLRNSDLSQPNFLTISRVDLITSIGKSKGGKTNMLLSESLTRLLEADFTIRHKNGECQHFGLLKSFSVERPLEQNCTIHLQIDENLSQQYSGNGWTLLRKSVRTQLSSPISKWLYAYFCSHGNKPYHILTETVREQLSRFGAYESKWLAQLVDALKELKLATGWQTCELVDRRKIVVIKDHVLSTSGGQEALAQATSGDSCDDI